MTINTTNPITHSPTSIYDLVDNDIIELSMLNATQRAEYDAEKADRDAVEDAYDRHQEAMCGCDQLPDDDSDTSYYADIALTRALAGDPAYAQCAPDFKPTFTGIEAADWIPF